MGDEALLERAITNILNNALRYARTRIVLSIQEAENGLEIDLSNDGEAIDPAMMWAISFERFYKGKNGNFGIGLAMTKEIIER